MKKNIFTVTTAGVCVAVCATGCTHPGTVENGQALVSKVDSEIVISVLAGQSTSDAGIEDMINEMAAEKYPNLKLEWECVDWGDSFNSQMQGKAAAGDIPDLIIGKAQDAVPYGRNGVIEPIYIEGMERIDEDVRKSVSIDGTMYGLPYNAWYQGVLYNKKIFEQYGLCVPKTRQELNEIVDKLESENIIPFASHFQETWNVGNTTMQFLIGDVFQKEEDWGGQFREEKVGFAKNPVIQKCFQQNEYVLSHSFADAMMIDQYECDKRFAEGGAAMYLTGSWSLQAFEQYAEEGGGYGIFPYPNLTGDSNLIKETNMTFMIGKGSSHKEQVEEILRELLKNEKLMQEILGFTQTYPVVEGMQINYRSSIQQDVERFEEEGRITDAARGNGQLVWSFQNLVAEETNKWLSGEQSLEDVLRYADQNRDSS